MQQLQTKQSICEFMEREMYRKLNPLESITKSNETRLNYHKQSTVCMRTVNLPVVIISFYSNEIKSTTHFKQLKFVFERTNLNIVKYIE